VGSGTQGFTEWQSANMVNRTNKLVTDIIINLMQYKCGLPQGNGFSVEIANLYAMLLVLWWNMDPINPNGVITSFTSPWHSFPLFAGSTLKPISSLAYVNDAKRFIAVSKQDCTCEEFFNIVQGYCDLLADLSLVIKMGRNVKKCSINLYNIPEDTPIPTFNSTALSFDVQGPIKGSIKTVIMRKDMEGNLICCQIPKEIRNSKAHYIKNILADRKYLGVPTNAQLESCDGKEKLINKVKQRIALISKNTNSIQEAKILHNMLVCQVATFSPICIPMMLKKTTSIDKQLLADYQYRLKYMPSDAKHAIFISEKKGGVGIQSFTCQYMGSLLRDIEVYISGKSSMTTHVLISSLEEATKKYIWHLHRDGKIPNNTNAAVRASVYIISGKKTLIFQDNTETPYAEIITYDHVHTMERVKRSTC